MQRLQTFFIDQLYSPSLVVDNTIRQ